MAWNYSPEGSGGVILCRSGCGRGSCCCRPFQDSTTFRPRLISSCRSRTRRNRATNKVLGAAELDHRPIRWVDRVGLVW
jgi:hypothetical protein